jgi:hypothetical protein
MDVLLSGRNSHDFFTEFFDMAVDGAIGYDALVRVNPVHKLLASVNGEQKPLTTIL